MPFEYGTLEPVVAEKRSNKAIAIVAGVLVVSAFVALSFTVGSGKTNSAINSNLGRAEITSIDTSVKTYFEAVCNDVNERYVVAAFNNGRDAIVPWVKAKATDNWERDWDSFRNSLPDVDDKPGVAFGVYNFPAWDDANDYTVHPTFVAFFAEGGDIADKYLGGSYLGGAAIAASCVGKSNIVVSSSDSYVDACAKVTGDAAKCRAVAEDECPFEGALSPCFSLPCEGESFVRGQIEGACCDAVKTWCAQPGQTGCSNYAMAIYDANCDADYFALEKSQKKMLEGIENEEDICAAACRSPCGFMEKADTFRLCSGCATDVHVYDYDGDSFAAKCHPDASGFLAQRCCGVGPAFESCGAFGQEELCETLSDVEDGCQWVTHIECGALLAAYVPPTEPPVVEEVVEETPVEEETEVGE